MTDSISVLKWSSRIALAGVFATSLSAANAAPPGDVPFGAYDPPGDFTDDENVQIEHLFLPWEDVYLPSLLDADQYAFDRNRAVLVTIEPWTWVRSDRNTPEALKAGISSGEYDHLMRDICVTLNEMQSAVTVRWAQEMDDTSSQFIWSGWKPETYINAYRRMIDLCREVAPEITVMWSPLGFESMTKYYPGDDYVDLVGLSAFGLQKYEEAEFGRALSFTDVLGPRYDRALQYDKPIVVPELGYVGDADYVESWESAVRQSYTRFPDLVGVVYFNQKEVYPWPDYSLPDWRITRRVIEPVNSN